MPKDSGGWRSSGRQTTCRKCGNDDARLLETTIYGRTRRHVYCAICANDWIEREDDEDHDSDR